MAQPQNQHTPPPRAVVVIGGAGGIGKAIVARLLHDGYTAVVIDRSPENCAALGDALLRSHRLRIHSADALDLPSVTAVLEDTMRGGCVLHGLVHSAGTAAVKRAFRAMPIEEWRRVLDDSLTSAFLSVQAAAHKMYPQACGRIILISSIFAVHIGTSLDDVAYTSAKSALHGMVRSLGRTLGRRNITVNAVAPGLVSTELTEVIMDPALGAVGGEASWRLVCPMRRLCLPDDVAGAVSFLLSSDAAFINGAVIPVDGGFQC